MAGSVPSRLVLIVMLALPGAGLAQESRNSFPEGSPLTALPVYEAPFSAIAVTTANLRFPGGTRLSNRTTARYFRDTNGRVRIENRMEGVPAQGSRSARHLRLLLLSNPCESIRPVDAASRTFRFAPKDLVAETTGADLMVPVGGARFLHVVPRPRDMASGRAPLPPGTLVDEEMLGSREIEGVDTVGYRVTTTTLAGQVGNDRPIVVTDEWWYSPDLRLVMAADYTNSDLGSVSYRITQLRTDDPPDRLFTAPEDYARDVTEGPHDPMLTFIPLAGYESWRKRQQN